MAEGRLEDLPEALFESAPSDHDTTSAFRVVPPDINSDGAEADQPLSAEAGL